MGMEVRTNKSARTASRYTGKNTSKTAKNLQRLASGYRINSAADDASGLAVSEKMKAQIEGLDQAAENSQDGISLVQTAEGAITQIHSILDRMVGLATKSANGTIQDEVDREAIQEEVDQLNQEITRIAESTNFNGINLLDGSLDGTGGGTSAGVLSGGIVTSFRAATTYTTSAQDMSGFNTAASWAVSTHMSIDGTMVKIDWSELTAEEHAALSLDFTAGQNETTIKRAASIIEKAINNGIDKTNANNDSNIAHVRVKSSLLAGSGEFEIISGMKDNKASDLIFRGDGQPHAGFGDYLSKVMGFTGGTHFASLDKFSGDPAEVNGKHFNMILDGEAVDVEASPTMISTGFTEGENNAANLKTQLDIALNHYATSKGLSNEQRQHLLAAISVNFSQDGRYEIANTTGMSLSFADKDGDIAATTLGLTTESKAQSGGLTLQIGATAEDYDKVTLNVEDLSAKGIGTEGLSVSTQASASSAVEVVRSAINKVSMNRSSLGALQNRLEYTIENLNTTSENLTAANSAIRDTDMATEMTVYTQNNVLTQAAQAMLAQANQNPQQVLQLLQ